MPSFEQTQAKNKEYRDWWGREEGVYSALRFLSLFAHISNFKDFRLPLFIFGLPPLISPNIGLGVIFVLLYTDLYCIPSLEMTHKLQVYNAGCCCKGRGSSLLLSRQSSFSLRPKLPRMSLLRFTYPYMRRDSSSFCW